MHRLFSSRTQSLCTAAVLAAAFVVAMYVVQGERAKAALPSSKVAVAMGSLVDLEASALSPNEDAGDANTTGWRNVMKTGIQVNSQGDLVMDLAVQCALLTDTTVRSKAGTLDTSKAAAGIRFRIALYPYTDNGVLAGTPIIAQPEDDPATIDAFSSTGDGTGVTYCERYQELQGQFAGFDCTANTTTGVITCAQEEMLRLLLKTLDAHSFNFFAVNLDSGRYWVVVQGRADALAIDDAGAKAMAGLGSLVVEKVRLVKSATLTTGCPTTGCPSVD